jgi:hypothetical protein
VSPRCRQNRDDREARDEDRRRDYDAEERNDASAQLCRNPQGRVFRDLFSVSLAAANLRVFPNPGRMRA